jgi:hypothetical protein
LVLGPFWDQLAVRGGLEQASDGIYAARRARHCAISATVHAAVTALNPSALDRGSSGRQRSLAALRGGSGSRAAGNREIRLDFNPNVDT